MTDAESYPAGAKRRSGERRAANALPETRATLPSP